jgi:hypothetical protein
VTPQPVANDGFTFERVGAFQCVAGEQYTTPEISDERQYFTKHAAHAIVVINTDAITPKSLLLTKFAEAVEPLLDQDDVLEEILKLTSIQYGQLTKKTLTHNQIQKSRCPLANDPAYVPAEVFESFEISFDALGKKITTKRFVQAPQSEGGWYAELTGDRGLKYKVVLEFSVKIDMNEDEDGDGPYGSPTHRTQALPTVPKFLGALCTEPPMIYGARFEFGNRTKTNVYQAGQSVSEHCIKLTLGNFNPTTGRLVAWKNGFTAAGLTTPSMETCLAHAELSGLLFDQTKWLATQYEDHDVSGGFGGDAECIDMGIMRGQYTYVTVDDCMCIEKYNPQTKTNDPIKIANFCIPKILALYGYAEGDNAPMVKLLARRRLCPCDPEDDVICYVYVEDSERQPSLRGCTVLEVEVIVQHTLYKHAQEVTAVFGDTHPLLLIENLQPSMLCGFLMSKDLPLPQSVIVRWGLQNSGYFVMHNAAFKNGVVKTVEESGHAIAPAFFNKNAVCPIPTPDFPRMIIIPFPHVRFAIGVDVWHNQMPAFFRNNVLPAKVRPPNECPNPRPGGTRVVRPLGMGGEGGIHRTSHPVAPARCVVCLFARSARVARGQVLGWTDGSRARSSRRMGPLYRAWLRCVLC